MRSQPDKLWGRTALFLATGGGVGFSRLMPGTVGSLWGIPLVWCLQRLGLFSIVYAVIAVAIVLASIPICTRAATKLGRKDPAQVVLDEIAAFPIVFFAVQLNLTTGVIGFLWFRLFDIAKPWPMQRLERLPGGIGIVTDDLAAGLYAAATLWGTIQLFEF